MLPQSTLGPSRARRYDRTRSCLARMFAVMIIVAVVIPYCDASFTSGCWVFFFARHERVYAAKLSIAHDIHCYDYVY